MWEEYPAISFKVFESFKAFKIRHPSRLVSLYLLPISLLLFSGTGNLSGVGWNFLSVLPCEAQGREPSNNSDSATAVFVFIVSSTGWWRVQNEAFSSCHRSSQAVGLFSLTKFTSVWTLTSYYLSPLEQAEVLHRAFLHSFLLTSALTFNCICCSPFRFCSVAPSVVVSVSHSVQSPPYRQCLPCETFWDYFFHTTFYS